MKIALSVKNLLCLKGSKGEKVFVIEQMAPSWDTVGLMLKFTEAELANIKKSFQGNAADCCKEMMTKWLAGFVQDKTDPLSWPTLLEALRDSRLDVLADEVAGIVL